MAKVLFVQNRSRVRTARIAAVAAALLSMSLPAWGAPITCAKAHKVFNANCVMCHMSTGRGNAAIGTPNFTDPKWQAEHKNPELYTAVENGVKDTAMPSWKAQFSRQEIEALVKCVVRGFGKKKDPSAHHYSATKSKK